MCYFGLACFHTPKHTDSAHPHPPIPKWIGNLIGITMGRRRRIQIYFIPRVKEFPLMRKSIG
jgi:hypothetical protein